MFRPAAACFRCLRLRPARASPIATWSASLRRSGFLRSIRGPRGGYQLVAPPAEVVVLEVVRCLEGLPSASDQDGQASVEWRALRAFEAELEQARLSLLGGTTLQDLLERRDALIDNHAMYFI